MGNTGRSILVTAAHSDDEVLGCGGTIAAHAAAGDEVHILIFAHGGTGVRGHGHPMVAATPREIAVKSEDSYAAPGERNAFCAARILGAQSLMVLAFPDSKFETLPILEFAHKVEFMLAMFKPAIVYTHHGGDLSMDHRWVHQAVVAACRPKPGVSINTVLFFEVPSATDWAQGAFQPFIPTVFQPLGQSAWDAKEKALCEAYGVEMRAQGHPRSIESVKALAVVRGASIGHPMAEAFVVGRICRNI